jgi:hypothetical protein
MRRPVLRCWMWQALLPALSARAAEPSEREKERERGERERGEREGRERERREGEKRERRSCETYFSAGFTRCT